MRTKYCTANYPTKASIVLRLLHHRGVDVWAECKRLSARDGRRWHPYDYAEHHKLFRRNTKDELIEMARKEIPDWASSCFPPEELTIIADDDTLDCIFD